MNRPSFALSVLLAALAGSLVATGSASSQTRSVLVNKAKTGTPGHRTGVEKIPGPVRVEGAKRVPMPLSIDELCRVQFVKIPFAVNDGESSQVIVASTEVEEMTDRNCVGEIDCETGYRCWIDEYQFGEKMASKATEAAGNLVDEILNSGKNPAEKLAVNDSDTEEYFTPADAFTPDAAEQPAAPEVDEQPETYLPEAVLPELKPEIVPLATDIPAEAFSELEDDLWNGGEAVPVRIGAILPKFDELSKVAGWGILRCEQLVDLAGLQSMELGERWVAMHQKLDNRPGFFGQMKVRFLLTMQGHYHMLRMAQLWDGDDYRGVLSLRDIYSLEAELAPLPEAAAVKDRTPEVAEEEVPAAGGEWVVDLSRQMLVNLAGTLEGTANQLYALSSELHQAAGEMQPALSSRPSRRIR